MSAFASYASVRSRLFGLALAGCAGALAAGAAGCNGQRGREERVQSTSASLEVLHPDVTVYSAAGTAAAPRTRARIEDDGRVVTGPAGRAIVRTDDGLEVRLAGDTEVVFRQGRAQLERGRAFVSSWGEEERTLRVGANVTLGIGDAAIEAERTRADDIKVVAVRGEIAWRLPNQLGRLQQGEALEGRGAPRVRPAGVWDDWTGGAASPQGAAHRGSVGAGEAVIHMDDGEAPTELAVNEHRVNVTVEGDVAVTIVSQRFFNGADRTAPVEYRVRVPEGAIVAGFAVERDNTVTQAGPGTVASLGQNGRGALVQGGDGGLYARLDPLAPGQTVRCELRYVEWLAHENGRRAYVYPMGDPVAPPFVGEFNFELTATRANVARLRGPAGAQVDGERLRYARSDFRPRADLHVDLFDRTAPASPSARVWLSPQDSLERYLLADVTIPPPADQNTDLIVLLDDSAGMDTGTLNVAAAAVDALLHVLGPNDRIALMFGDLAARPAAGAAGEMAGVSDARREAILEAISRARPAGATNLARMLSDAYGRLDPRRNGAVIYLGDAMPTMGALDGERLVDETLRVAPDLRLYAITLGNSPHPEVLARLASRGGLLAEARDQPQAVAAAERIAAHAVRPVLRDVTIGLGGAVAHPLPGTLEQWVAGDPLRVYGELTGPLPSRVTVEAREGIARRTWSVTATVDTVHDQGDIRRRWALSRIHTLEGYGTSRGALADLGVRFGLITPMSALVLGGAASGGDGNAGVDVAGSLWTPVVMRTRLPRLGLSEELAPRGVRMMNEAPEYQIVTDDESGWSRHGLGDGLGVTDSYAYTLSAADPAAQACIERARALRPQLAGTITVTATVAADGRVTNAVVASSSLGNISADSCVRRAVAGLTLPAPTLFGARPGNYSRTFDYSVSYAQPARRGCPPSSRLDRDARLVLWRERLANNPANSPQVWQNALFRCELRVWEDRAALLDLIVQTANDPTELAAVRALLDTNATKYFERGVARRWGPSRTWRAYVATQGVINWDGLIRQLNDARVPIDRKIELVQAYRLLAPSDIDLRLRLLSLYEQAGRRREARRLADELRADPYSDARVRALVGELMIRAGDRDEGLRAFSEIAEFAPYDTNARGRLGDLLLTYGGADWASEAYLQYQTLAALRPGDPSARVRMALAATVAGREDEALRILRAVAEDTGADQTTPAVEALLVSEVARLAAARGQDPAVQSWTRIARLMRLAREGGVVARWSHPEVGLELRAQQAGDNGFVGVGELGSPLNVRVFSPGSALEGSRLLLRANGGLAGARTVTAHLALVRPEAGIPRLLETEVTLNAGTRYAVFVVRNGQLVADTSAIPETERPAPSTEMY